MITATAVEQDEENHGYRHSSKMPFPKKCPGIVPRNGQPSTTPVYPAFLTHVLGQVRMYAPKMGSVPAALLKKLYAVKLVFG